MKFKFTGIGRGKKTFTEEKDVVDLDWMCGKVRPHLMSGCVDVVESKDDKNKFLVLVGGFRHVGTITKVGKK
jgi:hypothetical protein